MNEIEIMEETKNACLNMADKIETLLSREFAQKAQDSPAIYTGQLKTVRRYSNLVTRQLLIFRKMVDIAIL